MRLSSERTPIELPRDKLDRLTGSYELAPTATMRITVVGNQLQSQLGGQPVVPLFAESETVSFPRVVEAELTLELDASGKATALVLKQNGQLMSQATGQAKPRRRSSPSRSGNSS